MPTTVKSGALRATTRALLSDSREGQPLRYLVVGGVVFLTYLGLTLLLSGPLEVPIEPAIVISYLLAVALHFALQRVYVFAHIAEFKLAVHQQVGRYILIGAAQLALTTASAKWLPDVLGLSEQVVYVLTVVLLTTGGFLLLRHRVFHGHEAPTPRQPSGGGSPRR